MDDRTEAKNIDLLIRELGGCGPYQLILACFAFLPKIVASMSMIMMVFGNYNPGWECLDNSTSIDTVLDNLTTTGIDSKPNHTDDECTSFDRCNNVQFTPGVVTVVTEWNLICDRSWISSLIISIQMVGVLIGAYLSGYLGDKFGRKMAVYSAVFYIMIMNIIAIFSFSWQMFAAMRFLIGLAIPIAIYIPEIFAMEFSTPKWRTAIACLPVWPCGLIFFALVAMATENWRHLHAIVVAVSFLILLPVFWMPESLRWLVLRGEMKQAKAVVKKIGSYNGCDDKGGETVEEIAILYRSQPQVKNYSCFQLWPKGLRYQTFVVGFMCFFMNMIYYAISFSVKSISGNFYSNLLFLFTAPIPVALIASFLPNYTGRKLAIIIFLSVGYLSLFAIVGLDRGATGSTKGVGTLVFAILARSFVGIAWDVSVVYTSELYPTMIRSTSVAYTNWASRIGGILAPYLIPDDPDTIYINYLVMGIGALVCCVLVVFVRETKGLPLDDTWATTVPGPTKLIEAFEADADMEESSENGKRKSEEKTSC